MPARAGACAWRTGKTIKCCGRGIRCTRIPPAQRRRSKRPPCLYAWLRIVWGVFGGGAECRDDSKNIRAKCLMLVNFSSDFGEKLFRRKRLLRFEKMAFSQNLSRISLNLYESEPNVRFNFDCCRPLCLIPRRARLFLDDGRRFAIEQARKMARRVCADSGECRLRRQATRGQCVQIKKLHDLLKRWLVCQEESVHYSVVDGEPKLVALSKNYTPSNVCW